MNLLEPGGRCWVLFTPWHLDDLNARLSATRPTPSCGRPVGPELEPVWPRRLAGKGAQEAKGGDRLAVVRSRLSPHARLRGGNAHPPRLGKVLTRRTSRPQGRKSSSPLTPPSRAAPRGPHRAPWCWGASGAGVLPAAAGKAALSKSTSSPRPPAASRPRTRRAHRRVRPTMEPVGDPLRIERRLPGIEGPAHLADAIRRETQERDAIRPQGRAGWPPSASSSRTGPSASRARTRNRTPQRELYEEMLTFPFGEATTSSTPPQWAPVPPESKGAHDLVIASPRRLGLLSGEPRAFSASRPENGEPGAFSASRPEAQDRSQDATRRRRPAVEPRQQKPGRR